MKTRSKSWRIASRPRRAFTFIELIVAVALSIILLRGMYTILTSATDLTTLSEERMGLMLEASAIFDYIGRDLARVPYSGGQLFTVSDGGETLIFKATGAASSHLHVYIRYKFENPGGEDYGMIIRGVYSDEECTAAVDDDGDGPNDVNMAIGRKVAAFDVKYHSGGDIDGSWSSATTESTRAVKFIMKLGSVTTVEPTLPDETFTIIIPILSPN